MEAFRAEYVRQWQSLTNVNNTTAGLSVLRCYTSDHKSLRKSNFHLRMLRSFLNTAPTATRDGIAFHQLGIEIKKIDTETG